MHEAKALGYKGHNFSLLPLDVQIYNDYILYTNHSLNFQTKYNLEVNSSLNVLHQHVLGVLMYYTCVVVWLKLHTRMVAVIPGLNRTAEACKKKFNVLYKQYRLDKMVNRVSGSDRHEYKFYNTFDQW